ncbi:hypothetical protein WICANDRAFT_34510 [Wickerhamomyces anomalus NRRL Y-366-8]|uniref:U1-type domain-containing protein n=1 Tax=Wickerhamomyces anomalus (strain ATCC 58044 / CBS 1984 / NCYC 433 / NRRL Y-366-8) TaxID=683960 RepID=A0A1E3NYN0_WICAA|nr:uncharacterized protein WICANDRAFT_34510 [Wickerhamomyces anomalus NRRL Y-366-8]ODQ58100.1 hypothetical protein WICANDRAFT_34510 [Wickerhamomyces anomalus NRRL Y-366-8]
MDYQNRAGSKKGGGGVASASEANAYRRERIKKLVSNTIDIDNDPYVFKNHVGLLECRLCLTTHSTPESFLTHTQGRKHQMNLQKRSIFEQKHNNNNLSNLEKSGISGIQTKKSVNKIGKPGYKVMKIRHPESLEIGLLINVKFPKLNKDEIPQYRFMSVYESNLEKVKDDRFQLLIVSGDPYENIAFKIPSKEIYRNDDDNSNNSNDFWTFWDEDTKEFYIQFFYKGVS